MEKVKISVGTIIIPTYNEPAAEEYPMFSENRIHQRSSGRPYPNKVVMKVDRSEKTDKKYKLVTLENKYIRVEILPEIGGRIYSAYDKTTGYDFFYKQHVIKPAFIGVLGSWISGGVEFNWPFHHRASGFMPCDFITEELPDGSAVCWLSEHDPIDRMKGMFGIVLRPDCAYFETRMRLYNRTPNDRSFLWWENAAVPVNENYQIFFPQDVRYVNFHYLKSRITYPIAGNGVFNGIPMKEDRDISWHKNTREATSYFASASQFDFFGGYDHGKQCGVVHIGDHHVSPGKKMFTWAYNQLATSWENALTDTDGQYAELMAGSYSDNQPNFSWLAPYETKQFSQFWYPISKIGAPTFANLNCAFRIDREKGELNLISTAEYNCATVKVFDNNKTYLEINSRLSPDKAVKVALPEIPRFVTVEVTFNDGVIAEYTERDFDKFNMPEVITDMPSAACMERAQDLYLAGVHVAQYRDPATNPDAYWKEALKRDINHIPSLIAMANYEYDCYDLESAEKYIVRAINGLNIFNERHQSGQAYYTYGKILEAMGEYDKAYDYYNKASWAADSVAKAMTRIAVIDIRRKNYAEAVRHAETALDYSRNASLAAAVLVIARRELGNDNKALITEVLKKDPLDHMMRFLSGAKDFYEILDSNPTQTCLDIAFDLDAMGRYEDIVRLLSGLGSKDKMLYYVLGYYKYLCVGDGLCEYEKAEKCELGRVYPHRFEEKKILRDVINKTESKTAKMLLGCLLYNKLHYTEATALWKECDDRISKRNLAVAYFSHLGRGTEALSIMTELVDKYPDDEQLLYETVCLMDKMCVKPNEKIKLMTSHKITRDDVLTELSKAYNQAFMPDKALETLTSHNFVPCEGGEHAIADQYMFAYLVKGKTAYDSGDYKNALELFRKGQVLPQSLGAGIWNHCKRVPLKYHEALCLEALGEEQAAREIYRYISTIEIEYFSNMHLKELPFYQALACDRLSQSIKAQNIITKYYCEWKKIIDVRDNGYFSTTPFFISFVDSAQKLRHAQYLYLTGLCEAYMQKNSAKETLAESVKLNNDNMADVFWNRFI